LRGEADCRTTTTTGGKVDEELNTKGAWRVGGKVDEELTTTWRVAGRRHDNAVLEFQ
jgi:hypothetical protein